MTLTYNIEDLVIESVTSRRLIHDFIYKLSDGSVAKPFIFEDEAENEFEFGRFCYDKGLNVPNTYKLIKISDLHTPHKKGTHWFVIREYIKGKSLEELYGEKFKYCLELQKTELEKVMRLGVAPCDSIKYDSAIYDEKNDRVFLIDFALWSRDKRELLNSYKYLQLYFKHASIDRNFIDRLNEADVDKFNEVINEGITATTKL